MADSSLTGARRISLGSECDSILINDALFPYVSNHYTPRSTIVMTYQLMFSAVDSEQIYAVGRTTAPGSVTTLYYYDSLSMFEFV